MLSSTKAWHPADAAVRVALYDNCQQAKDGTEQSRYFQKTQAEAERLFEAVTHPADGVMQWIRLRW